MRSIVMTAGCSGCGSAAVTAAVARQMARQGKRVLLAEATAGLRRMNGLLDVREEGLFDLCDLLEGRFLVLRRGRKTYHLVKVVG